MNIPVFDALTGDLRYILTFRYKRIKEMKSVYLPRTLPSLETDFFFLVSQSSLKMPLLHIIATKMNLRFASRVLAGG